MNLNIGHILESVDPFIGTAATELPAARGLAASWWWPKAQVGNTHPGACHPLGMVSACACSGAYPTGYGRYGISTEGAPEPIYDDYLASGFTHFQQSGTGAIRKYYNYFRVTPMVEPLDALGTRWRLHDEVAEPGYYAATLDTGIRCELTVGAKTAVHRYTFPASASARVVLDFSYGGLAIEHGGTVPLRAEMQSLGHGRAQGTVVMEGVPISVYIKSDTPGWRQLCWYDRRRVDGGTRLDFDYIRRTTLRPFGLMFMGPTEPGQAIELRMGFSLRGCEQARRNLEEGTPEPATFDARRERTAEAWNEYFDQIRVDGGTPERRTVFATSVYHSLIKPCFAEDESPFWPSDGPFVFDISTMWDMYKTQFPLLTALSPTMGAEMLESLVRICEEEGNLPIGYRMARGSDRFFRQASALAHTALADGYRLGLPGVDWDWALVHMVDDLRRGFGEDFYERGIVHPISHTLDLACGYHCAAQVARGLGDEKLAGFLEEKARNWINAFDPSNGLLKDSSFYEGGRWNYSFRLLHDMAARIGLAGGDTEFTAMLDRFFGFGAPPVTQLGTPPFGTELSIGGDLNRFEGLNNEPDMEAPWAYHYAGRPDRTAEVVHAALAYQFGTGRGGLPGNDDSGGLSSWYVWASLGLFPVAGQNLFLVNAPAFAGAALRFGGNEFEIATTGHVESGIGDDAEGSSPRYVQSARFNGRPLEHGYITGNQLHGGGTLEIELGPEPSDWATKTRPPSVSDRPDDARGGGTRFQEFLL
ncbi:glycoside hydrolase family 92 protein [Glycomyces sp. L485]|uniref:glycoside hydrolase domain-containing protein n=1 Tax=Glycomyces sp. L485 TaxID=2909235 RepID=UPI001F4A9A89|nr:glycoside hydrolase domain-containing protein [Glycomyces sp. L485]MCH7229569.1 glycoside hydrolase family 92 protein [Glycomyces sp. L485]